MNGCGVGREIFPVDLVLFGFKKVDRCGVGREVFPVDLVRILG
jgi:hypothetical protein